MHAMDITIPSIPDEGKAACSARFVGIDVGAETVKIVELRPGDAGLRWTRRLLVPHAKRPGEAVVTALADWDWDEVQAAAVCGRLSRRVALARVPTPQAQAHGFRFLVDEAPATLVSIGSHGFSVLELRSRDQHVLRENSRCSQGTGNFLRQLLERLGLTIEDACRLARDVTDAAALSGRCPVILKTDMTHLANKGEDRGRIVAGLFDAVCENVEALIKATSPPRVVLLGGVPRAPRVREHFGRFLASRGMELLAFDDSEAGLYADALGSAVIASTLRPGVPRLPDLIEASTTVRFDRLPPLSDSLGRVRRMRHEGAPTAGQPQRVILGLDIGSTGSKVVALDAERGRPVWQSYTATAGNPVGAAHTLAKTFAASRFGGVAVCGFGVTGSGREIVGSLLSTCYGSAPVYILNEIAAHAEGALYYDRRVDTIFEIGGQDAKYIRLSGGRVVDAAMNEACSAGTGSFIEEQGGKFPGIRDVVHLGEEALAAAEGVSLGQHCSVFMAEVIDDAAAAGIPSRCTIAGIYDSVVQNYLNRVKGNRSVGSVVFCQGMPFASDALAAAVARRTGSEVVVPPDPGMVGALGIALLARRAGAPAGGPGGTGWPLERFLAARLEKKDVFVCRASRGCGGGGNRCRIDHITTRVAGVRQQFTWGGGCSLHDRGAHKRKLPDRAPDPFREREERIEALLASVPLRGGRPVVALTDAFALKTLFPFFVTFLYELGFDVSVHRGADRRSLGRGVEGANVPFCAPMQHYHGLLQQMAEGGAAWLFTPMIRSLPRVKDEPAAVVCPIVQGSPDVLRLDLPEHRRDALLSPVIDVDAGGLEGAAFVGSCRRLATELGRAGAFELAWEWARSAQRAFEAALLEAGRRALRFCAEHGIVPVVVQGRPYTIHNTVLSSNVPALLREQGAIAIPIDCFPVEADTPAFRDVFWAHGQTNLRAAHQIRRTPGVYSLYCSNYSCGPDSFVLHFYAYAMDGKPYAIIETDGHSGDAGTKTRIEAFLHCVDGDRMVAAPETPKDLRRLQSQATTLAEVRARGDRILIPRMGPGAEAVAACVRAAGIPAESLPMPDRAALGLGRRFTSGKECLPMCLTLGSLLQRVDREPDPGTTFTFALATSAGPCRLGAYAMLDRIALERLGWTDRVHLWCLSDAGYFDGLPSGFEALVCTAFVASDVLLEALYDARPGEVQAGAAAGIYARRFRELIALLERQEVADLTATRALVEIATGRLFGVRDLLRGAARELAAVRRPRPMPTVLVLGENYVRCDPFANDFVIDKLEARGLRCRFAPFNEWIEYVDAWKEMIGEAKGVRGWLKPRLRARIQETAYRAAGDVLKWPPRTRVSESMPAAAPYIRPEFFAGEAVLTIGTGVHEWREGVIDGVVAVGPFECMPTKIASSQLFHVAEREGLLSLTIAFNGEPMDLEALDSFAYEVCTRWERRWHAQAGQGATASCRGVGAPRGEWERQ